MKLLQVRLPQLMRFSSNNTSLLKSYKVIMSFNTILPTTTTPFYGCTVYVFDVKTVFDMKTKLTTILLEHFRSKNFIGRTNSREFK